METKYGFAPKFIIMVNGIFVLPCDGDGVFYQGDSL
jgi:hypothetical protein